MDVARAHQDFHAQAFGHGASNVEFHHGYIEKLDELDLEPGSFDIIVSNCVINLATDKEAVLRGAHRLLKEGGEMYFSDVYADRRVPQAMAKPKPPPMVKPFMMAVAGFAKSYMTPFIWYSK